MIIPRDYVDPDNLGITSKKYNPDEKEFNLIVFLYWYVKQRQVSGKLNTYDLDSLKYHLDKTNDDDGLYTLKNSHDNIKYKMLSKMNFHIGKIEDMSFFKAIIGAGIQRFWDIPIYGAVFGPKYLRWLFVPLLWISALFMIYSIRDKEKVRPDWFRFKKNYDHRIFWWFKRSKLKSMAVQPTKTYKHWILKNGDIKVSVHMNNDGKHLNLFLVDQLRHKFAAMKWCAKIVRNDLIKRYGDDYAAVIIQQYFEDQNHPLIPMWKGHGDILK